MATTSTAGEGAAPILGPLTLRERLLGWKEIFETANPPSERPRWTHSASGWSSRARPSSP